MMDKLQEVTFLDDVDANEQFYTCQWMDLDDWSKEPFRNQSIPIDWILLNLFRTTVQWMTDPSGLPDDWNQYQKPHLMECFKDYFWSSVKGPESNCTAPFNRHHIYPWLVKVAIHEKWLKGTRHGPCWQQCENSSTVTASPILHAW